MRKAVGFTLIEILVAVTIVAVLSAIGVTSYQSINKRTRDARRKSDLEQIRSALEFYRTDVGHYPYKCGWVSYTGYPYPMLKQLFEPDYMAAVPQDPKIGDGVTVGHVAAPSGHYGYMYSSEGCGEAGFKYALWAQLESPSAADIATISQGSVTQYNAGYGMNYKVSNPP